MIKPLISAAVCAVCLPSMTPAFAAGNTIPQHRRDAMSQKYTENQIKQQNKENREANHNVDRLITNRKYASTIVTGGIRYAHRLPGTAQRNPGSITAEASG